MERDAIIGHGSARLIKDRLFDNSDKFRIPLCNKCGMILSKPTECVACKSDKVSWVNIPYAAKLLFQKLQAMSIKVAIIPTE
jgi:DNA-directed RNA polymerase II subunit RPB2